MNTCERCGHPIEGDDLHVDAAGQTWHEDCYASWVQDEAARVLPDRFVPHADWYVPAP